MIKVLLIILIFNNNIYRLRCRYEEYNSFLEPYRNSCKKSMNRILVIKEKKAGELIGSQTTTANSWVDPVGRRMEFDRC